MWALAAQAMSSREEYLKRYLTGAGGGGSNTDDTGVDAQKKKRKKRPGGLDAPKAKVLTGAIKVVDNDVSLASLVPKEDSDEEKDEEAPVVVESVAARKAREVQVRRPSPAIEPDWTTRLGAGPAVCRGGRR